MSAFPTWDPSLRGTLYDEQLQAAFLAVRTGEADSSPPPAAVAGQLFANLDTGYEEQAQQADPTKRTQLWALDSSPLAVVPKYVALADCTAGVYTVDAGKETHIVVDAIAGDITIKLPAYGTVKSKHYVVFKADATTHKVTIIAADSVTVGPWGGGGIVLTKAYDFVVLWNAGAVAGGALGWQLIADNVRDVTTISTTGSHNVSVSAELVLADTGTAGGDMTLLLPTATYARRRLTIKQIGGTHTVTIATIAGVGQIDGAGSDTLTTQNQVKSYVSDGSNWWRVG